MDVRLSVMDVVLLISEVFKVQAIWDAREHKHSDRYYISNKWNEITWRFLLNTSNLNNKLLSTSKDSLAMFIAEAHSTHTPFLCNTRTSTELVFLIVALLLGSTISLACSHALSG